MPSIKSQLDPRSTEYRANHQHMRALVEDLRRQVARATLGGDEQARAKHAARGKLLPRPRPRAPPARTPPAHLCGKPCHPFPGVGPHCT